MEAKLVARWGRGDGNEKTAKRGIRMDFGGFSEGPGIKQSCVLLVISHRRTNGQRDQPTKQLTELLARE